MSCLSKGEEDRQFIGKHILTENDISPKSFGLRIIDESMFCFQKDGIIIIDPQETTLHNGDFILITNNNQKPFLRCVHKESEFTYLISPIQGMTATNLVPPTYSLGKVARYIKKFT